MLSLMEWTRICSDLSKNVMWLKMPEILRTAHEGTSKVKSSRIQLLTTKFEGLRMQEDETIQDYYMNVLDIGN